MGSTDLIARRRDGRPARRQGRAARRQGRAARRPGQAARRAGRPARRAAGLVVAAAAVLLAAACSASGAHTRSAADTRANASAAARARASASAAAARARAAAAVRAVRITPGNGTTGANPSAGITVTADRGQLTDVTVRSPGQTVTGSLSHGGRIWHSRWALAPAQRYTVTATATSTSDGTVTRTVSFRTRTPARTFTTRIFEGYDQTYGVGMPILLYFSQRITHRAAVERALQVSTSKPVVGAWYWDDSCGSAPTCAYFRPRDYWPSGTTVSLTAHLDGVEGAPGVYGTHTLTQRFYIGASLVAVGNTATHRTQIYYNGKLRYNWPISSGKPGDATPDGSYLTIEKENPVRMKGPGYNLLVPWSVRFTFSGDYYHDAYWSVGQQGFENVSHGCVNLSPANAETYYHLAIPGDPITIVGSPKGGTWDNGWTEWFLSFPQYVKGSALHEAVEAGPGGSRFVSPSSLPPDTARAPLQTAPARNASA